MRLFAVLLILIAMPLSASAQHQQRSDRSPTGPGAIGLPLPAIGLPTPIPYQKPWEWTVPPPAWERPQPPAWDRQAPPAWERGHAARPVQPAPYPRGHQRNAGVIYVMQPYPVYEPYPVVITVVSPVAEPPPAPPAAAVEPEPPPPLPSVVVPIGSRTLYVIPGCYLGNVPPDAARLPARCDITLLKVFPPP